jgi:hypothetical protein
MQVQVDIEFEQLVNMAKSLPVGQWVKLKQEVEKTAKQKENHQTLKPFYYQHLLSPKSRLMI